jgi:hypothetical protein
MKKTLIIISLLVGVVIPLAGFGGCGGTKLSDSDLATIRGFSIRLDAHDQAIATIQNTIAGLDTDTLDKLAALDADALEALLDLDTDALINRLAALESWKTTMEARVAELETGSDGGDGGSPTPPSGQVTVALDVDEEPLTFMSGATAVGQVFPIKITNGTSEYETVTFGITLRCVSTDYKADVTGGYAMMVGGVATVATPVPNNTGCQMIYFLWTTTDKIPVAPGKEFHLYAILNNFVTPSGYELWEVTITSIVVAKL